MNNNFRNYLNRLKNNLIVKNISALFMGRIATIFISMLSSILMVRYLGPINNGIYNYAIALVTLFSGVGLLGLDNIIIKEFVKKERNKDDIFVSSFIVRMIGSIFAFILLILTLAILKCNSQTRFCALVVSVTFFVNIFSGVTGWYYSLSNSQYIVFAQIGSHFLCLIFRIICAYVDLGVLSFLIIQVLETGLLILIEWCLFWKDKTHIKVKCEIETIKYLIVQGLPICLGSIAYTLFMKIDQVMIGQMLGDYELGIYSLAVRIAELWYFVPNTIVVALLPKFTELYRMQDKTSFYAFFQKSMSALVLLGYISSIVTMVLSRPLIKILYGADFLPAAPILCLYIWSGVFINMSVLRGNYFVLTEWTKCSFFTNAMGAAINIILNYFLIQIVGSIGAVIATLVSYAVYAYVSSFIIPRLRRVGVIQTKSFFLQGLFKEGIRGII